MRSMEAVIKRVGPGPGELADILALQDQRLAAAKTLDLRGILGQMDVKRLARLRHRHLASFLGGRRAVIHLRDVHAKALARESGVDPDSDDFPGWSDWRFMGHEVIVDA